MEFPKGIFPPEGGWRPHTWYLVDVSVKYGNPVHRALMYTGFLNGKDGQPGGYHGIFSANVAPIDHGDVGTIYSYRYIKAIKVIVTEEEVRHRD
jgi:hypothetical protein